MKRTQIYLDDRQDAELAARANALGVTKSELIRAAIGRYLGTDELAVEDRVGAFRAAVASVAGIAPYLAAGAEHVELLRSADAARRIR